MSERDDSQERTEDATPKRLKEARDKGQIARSRELNTMTVLLAGGAGLLMLGPTMISGLLDMMRASFQAFEPAAVGTRFVERAFLDAVYDTIFNLIPFFLLMVVAAILAPMSLGGWSFSAQAMAFKWEKLDPVKGLKRVFGPNGLMELFKALAKFLVVAGVAVLLIRSHIDDFLGLGLMSAKQGLAEVGELLVRAFILISSALILIAAVDVPFQLWNNARQMRMTRQEVKDEYKETDGKPEVKQQIRNLQQEIAQRRMMEEVPKADVIVTNPTHFSVALRYDDKTMDAPLLVAKGTDLVAFRIREVGQAHRVPVLSSPMLARALYFSTKLNHPVPAGLYLAVAQLLAYVFQLRRRRGQPGRPPPPPRDLPIPEEYRHPPGTDRPPAKDDV